MALGFGRLRLSSDAFWQLTPRELAAATGPAPFARHPSRAELEALAARFPDRRAAG